MFKSAILKLCVAAMVAGLGTPALAQIQTIDPNDSGEYEPAATTPTSDAVAAEPAATPEYQPIDAGVSADVATAPAAASTTARSATSASAATLPREDVFNAAEGVFGKGAEGLAGVLEKILKDQGEPTAYIAGREAGGAFVAGVRYGSGTMRHQIEGDRLVYWTGPSLGFDFGADASKVFVLVYNLHDSQELFKRFAAAEGHAYALGGFTASYLRRGDVVLIPVRLGVGLRLGLNAGYMRFSEKNRWLPF